MRMSDNPFKDLLDLYDSAMEVIDDNSDTIDRLFDRQGVIDVSGRDLLVDAQMEGDEVHVVMEVKEEPESIKVEQNNDRTKIHVNDRTEKFNMPEGVNISSVKMNVNNGVLDLIFPIEGGEEDGNN